MEQTLLSIEHLKKSYDDNLILDDINLEVHQGEVIVLVGPSGCGKSTMLRCINALEPIQGGEIKLNGEKIDIFEWSDNISELIANALSPSTGVAVIPNDPVKDGLIVVVPDNQLSLAIGKRGKNARLAVKLTNHKIDIKSESEMQELGIDYMAISKKMQEEYEEKKAKERAYKQQQKIDELNSALKKLESEKTSYEDLVNVSTESQVESANQIYNNTIDFLWVLVFIG